MRTIRGSPFSVSITSVLITLCSGTPIEAEEWPVPPCSRYSNSCSEYFTPCCCSTAVAGVLAMSEECAREQARAGEDEEAAHGAAQLLGRQPHVDAAADRHADPGERGERQCPGEDRHVQQQSGYGVDDRAREGRDRYQRGDGRP